MADKRRRYTREFKLDAVRLAQQGDRTLTEVAESLGIDRSLISAWRKAFEKDGSLSFPGNGRRTPEEQELDRLRRQLAEAREERDILKNALAYFAKERK